MFNVRIDGANRQRIDVVQVAQVPREGEFVLKYTANPVTTAERLLVVEVAWVTSPVKDAQTGQEFVAVLTVTPPATG